MLLDLTRRNDRRLLPYLALAFLGPLAVLVVVGVVTGSYVILPVLGVLLAVVSTMLVFNFRSRRAVNRELEGKPGAAISLIQGMQGNWRVTPAVQVNRNQDLVHRVVGRAGVVLVAEGSGRGPRELLANEKRRVARVIGDTPVHDIVVGNGEGEVPLGKVTSKLQRLPRALNKNQVDSLDRRLKALAAQGAAGLPIPKGPIPTRVPRGKMR
jgi:uncharacterized protein (DUF58 family)